MSESPTTEQMNQLIARCRNDAAFHAQLVAQPRQTLAQAGITVPEGMNIRVLQSTPDKVYLPLPASATNLPDEALDAVAGGAGRQRQVALSKLLGGRDIASFLIGAYAIV